MKRRGDSSFKAAFDRASVDNTPTGIEMPLGACVSALLMVMDYITQLERGDNKIPALMELLGYFLVPVVDKYPATLELVSQVVYKATGYVVMVEK